MSVAVSRDSSRVFSSSSKLASLRFACSPSPNFLYLSSSPCWTILSSLSSSGAETPQRSCCRHCGMDRRCFCWFRLSQWPRCWSPVCVGSVWLAGRGEKKSERSWTPHSPSSSPCSTLLFSESWRLRTCRTQWTLWAQQCTRHWSQLRTKLSLQQTRNIFLGKLVISSDERCWSKNSYCPLSLTFNTIITAIMLFIKKVGASERWDDLGMM